jgi:hypothetical protein
MINFVVSSTSVVLVGLAVVISVLYPDNPAVRPFALALFSWFLALGPLRWLEGRIDDFVIFLDKNYNGDYKGIYTILDILYLIVEIVLIIVGSVYFVHGLGKLP